jgi:hypothetical protein
MDPAGLINKIFQAVVNIDFGRKGIMIEKAVLSQRAANMTTVQGRYIEKQKNAINGAR